jgi:hypothetical protein
MPPLASNKLSAETLLTPRTGRGSPTISATNVRVVSSQKIATLEDSACVWWCSFGLSRRADRLVKANVSEKRAVSIFRGWSDTRQPLKNPSTRRSISKEHNQNCHRPERLNSHSLLIQHCVSLEEPRGKRAVQSEECPVGVWNMARVAQTETCNYVQRLAACSTRYAWQTPPSPLHITPFSVHSPQL